MNTIRIEPKDFPTLIKQMHKQPEFLECAGALPPGDDYKYLCVIGARHHSDYGRDVCKYLIKGLKNYPIVIVSGLAYGIDSIAHEAALETSLKTIAFPGSGLSENVLYPQAHLRLAKRIIESGNTLLSAFEHDQTWAPWTFPQRNELMAGISHATLIIEGKEGSGTLLTANAALNLSRDLLIVPGSIFSDLSYGPHTLYRDGATPVTTSKEILMALGFEVPRDKSEKNDGKTKNSQQQLDFSFAKLSNEEKSIVRALQYSACSATDLIEKTGLDPMKFNILATQLELSGIIKQENGSYMIS